MLRHSVHLSQRPATRGFETLLVLMGTAPGQGYYFSKPVDPRECQALLSVVERRWAWQFSSPTLRAFK